MNKEPIKEEYRCLKLTMEKSKYDFIMTAIKDISKELGVNEARALELIIADWRAGQPPVIDSQLYSGD